MGSAVCCQQVRGRPKYAPMSGRDVTTGGSWLAAHVLDTAWLAMELLGRIPSLFEERLPQTLCLCLTCAAAIIG